MSRTDGVERRVTCPRCGRYLGTISMGGVGRVRLVFPPCPCGYELVLELRRPDKTQPRAESMIVAAVLT